MVGLLNDNYENSTFKNSIKNDLNDLYVNTGQYWWLVSPSVYNAGTTCLVYGDSYFLYRTWCFNPHYICPIVALKSNFQPEISN